MKCNFMNKVTLKLLLNIVNWAMEILVVEKLTRVVADLVCYDWPQAELVNWSNSAHSTVIGRSGTQFAVLLAGFGPW